MGSIHAFALGDPAQGVDEDGDVGDAFLEQVAEPAGLVGEQPLGVPGLEVLAEQDDRRLRVALADAPRRDQALVGMGGRHADVDDGRVGLVQGDHAQQVVGVGRLADDLHAGIREQPCESRPDQHDVVGDYDAHGITAVTTVSSSGVPDSVKRPPRAPTRSATSLNAAAAVVRLPACTSTRTVSVSRSWIGGDPCSRRR